MKKIFSLLIFLIFITSCKTVRHNIEEVKFMMYDIDNFYDALELASKDTINAQEIFKKDYFEKGSKGLDYFYKHKIKNLNKFTTFVLYYKDFYSSIKDDITNLKDLESEILVNYSNFKMIYPKAVFPDVYFVVGKFNSNGTASKEGIIIGTELLSKTEKTNDYLLDNNISKYLMERKNIPITVSHEIIHFNQNRMKNENTLLKYAIVEGSAEFICELITGKTDGSYENFKGREQKIWNDFVADMHKDIYREWHLENEPKRPKNALYWAGYLICKSYYEQVKDKEKVVFDILNCKDYDQFYNDSKVENYIKKNY